MDITVRHSAMRCTVMATPADMATDDRADLPLRVWV